MSDKTYDILNKLQRWLPAVGVLYLALSNIWGLPYGDAINATVVAVATFLASILEVSTVAYHKAQAEANKSLEWEGEDADVEHEDDWEGEG